MGGRGGDPLVAVAGPPGPVSPSCHLWVLGARRVLIRKAERALLAPPGMNVGLGGGSPQGRGAAVWQLLFLERWVHRTQGVPRAQLARALKAWLLPSLGTVGGWVGGWAWSSWGWLCSPFQGPVCLAGPAPAASLGGVIYASRQLPSAGNPQGLCAGEAVSSPEWAQQMAPGPPPPRGGS